MNITVGQIVGCLTAIASTIGAVVLIVQWVKKILLSVVKQPIEELKEDIADIKKDIADVNMNHVKSFLVRILSSVDRGEHLTDIERLRFSEEYDYYISHDGNSYIKEWYKRLHDKGLL